MAQDHSPPQRAAVLEAVLGGESRYWKLAHGREGSRVELR